MYVEFIAYSRFGSVPNKFIMSNVNCKGDEGAMEQCRHRRFDNCGGHQGAGVQYEGFHN